MRKINNEYENPIDDILLDLSEFVSPFFHNLGFNPNGLTFLSLITGVLSIYFLYKQQIIIFAILFFTSYFFDCLDGHFARKYDMVTKFGDLFDHYKDSFVAILLAVMLFYNYKNNKYILLAILLFIFLIVSSSIHMGCQQVLYNGTYTEDEYLDYLKPILHWLKFDNEEKCKDLIKYTRFFGSGTLNVGVILIIIFLHYTQNKN
jgi:phosphatidylglycerophosphate synthase